MCKYNIFMHMYMCIIYKKSMYRFSKTKFLENFPLK
jgi:hypothetical protein